MVYDPPEADAFRLRLLESPAERQNAEYKSSLPFDGKSDFSLKLLKHLQGMANSGGGHIIIGFTEDGDKPLEPDPKHTDEMASSYDQNKLTQAANASVTRGQSIRLTVHQTRLGDLDYPIIAVEPFKSQPVVCRSTQAGILREGAVYIRRPGAETSELCKPEDWEEIINRCVDLRHDDLLQRFGVLLDGRIGKAPPQEGAFEKLDGWTSEMRERAFGRE